MHKIDLHTHILPERWPDLRERYGYPGWVRLDHNTAAKPCCARMMIDDQHFRDVTANSWNPAERLRDCDRCGVTMQVLSTVPVMFSYWAKPHDALDLSQLLNDHLAGLCRDFPDRFMGLGTIPMQAPDLAIRELERCKRDLNLPGVQVGSNINGANLDEPGVVAVFEAAAALGAAVFVHPWQMLGQDRMPRYWLPWLVGMPAETCLAICSVIFGGVLEKLPTLRIGFAHGGGSFPGTIGRIDHGFHARPDLCGEKNTKGPRSYVAPVLPDGVDGCAEGQEGGACARFYVDSLVHDADALRRLVKLMGAERVALGSDYPFPLGEECPGGLIESVGEFDERTKARLLGGTALEFLGAGVSIAQRSEPRP